MRVEKATGEPMNAGVDRDSKIISKRGINNYPADVENKY